MTKLTPRNLDHLVLPVPDLETARSRYLRLGFTVAPDGSHKFGTENSCIKFADGTFIEPLAIRHRETVEANAKKGNNFLRRDAAYRFRNGDNGFWGIALGSENTAKDRKILKKAGYNTGKLVQVKRTGVHARLAFALDERAPDFSIFLCQDMIDMPPADPALVVHPNGVVGIAGVTLYEHLPEDFQYYIQTASGERRARSHSFGMDVKLPNATIRILNADGMKAYYGKTEIPSVRGLRAMAFDLAVENLAETEVLLKKNRIKTRKTGTRLIVDPADGQGAIIAFVEA
ncbi:MAG: VOC family protein [Rhizobiaceae bacterium]